MLTNKGLVEHAKMALAQKWGYVWGTFGQLLTEALFKAKLNQYSEGVGNYADFIMINWLNRFTTDCVGLIKSYLWWNGSTAVYNPKQDVSANGMYNAAKEKGPLSTLPEIPGICLWKDGHIGVYIGNGQVIEARGTKAGVIQSPLKGTGSAGWTNWLKCPFISYEGAAPSVMYPQLNSTGAEVIAMQKLLIMLGYGLVVDGDFGPKTDIALKDFQTKQKLTADGVYGPKTQEALKKATTKSPEEILVEEMVADGLVTDKQYWVDVLRGKTQPNPEYLKTVFTRATTKIV